jgi:AcrR family transcriptional regulator
MTSTARRSQQATRPVDRRVERTRQSLCEALLDLADDHDFDHITISDVAERADVNRATVYLHFRDLADLLVAALRGWIDESARMAADCCPATPALADARTPEVMIELFRRFECRSKLFAEVLGPNGSARVAYELRAVIGRHVRARMPVDDRPGDVPNSLRADFLSGALVGLLANWLSSTTRLPAPVVAESAWRLVRELSWGG